MRKIISARRTFISFIFIIYVVSITATLSSQCSFKCIDTINVSVNNICMATISPAMVLKAYNPLASCNYGIQLFDKDGKVINLDVTRADIGPQYVGQTLKVRIFEAGVSPANSCWGYINVEDKLPPDITCAGNDTLECYRHDIFANESEAKAHLENIIEKNLVDNCGNEKVTVNITNNKLTKLLCRGEFSAMRIVSYNVLNNNFDITSCIDTIYYQRFNLDSLDAPKNYSGNMSIKCTEPYPSVKYLIGKDSETPGNNSVPNINGISIADYIDSLFVERGLCNFKMVYRDLIFETCGNTYKIVRTWDVIDWCSSSSARIFNQVIKVIDDNISLASISNKGPFGAEEGRCDVIVTLPLPSVSNNECNSWTYTILIREPGGTLFFPFGGVRASTSQAATRRFPIGTSRVRYIVEDACGNTDFKEFNVTVVDVEPPIPVCDFRTVITLNDSFLGKVFAKSFDDGSYDNCSGIVSYKVRRVDRLTTTCPTPVDFDDFVKFCCADIGKAIMVELQITDGVGLKSSCMTEARVQYKGPGPIVSCAPGLPVQSCDDFDNFNINILTPPSITSANPCITNALIPLLRETDRSIDICGNGYIDVEWYYNLTGLEEVLCNYRINFQNLNPFTINDINWPSDRVINSCSDLSPTAQELANIIGGNNSCSNVFASEPVDKIFENVPNKCLFILRTWTVVDWCRYPANPNARWTYEQKIDVINSSGPVIDISGNNLTLTPNSNGCLSDISIEGIASDDCTPVAKLKWTYRLDLIENGQEIPLISERSGRILEGTLEPGNYIITWTATDGCGNTSLARQSFNISDSLFPVAICGFAIRDVNNSNNVVVTAAELNGGSTDNCNEPLSLGIRRAGQNTPLANELNFTCADLGVNNIELWVTDNSGNQTMCIASVDIRDGFGNCGIGASIITLNGLIRTPDEIAVESASVKLNMNNTELQSEFTEIDGQFVFEDLKENQKYTLSAEKNDDYINGISTLDIILMQRHILGLQTLDSPYKLLAADINNSKNVSAVDMVILRRLILGHITEFPDNDSWLFIDKNTQFSDPIHPWPVNKVVDLGLVEESINKELLAIKVGDLNGSVIANSGFAESRNANSYMLSKHITIEGNKIKCQIKATKNLDLMGYQIGLDFDENHLKLEDVRSDHIGIVEEMMNTLQGFLKISVATARPYLYQKGDVLLEVIFSGNVLTGGTSDLIKLTNPDHFSNELYDERLNVLNIELLDEIDGSEIILYQNRPNPFNNQTFIEFEIPKEDEVTFELFDINGSRVYSLKEKFGGGRHQISLIREDIGLNKGIYYYQIHTQQRSLIRKMIIL